MALLLEILVQRRDSKRTLVAIKNVQRTFYDTQLHLRVESFWITPSWQAALDWLWVPKSEGIGGYFSSETWMGGRGVLTPLAGHLSERFLVSLHIKNAVPGTVYHKVIKWILQIMFLNGAER